MSMTACINHGTHLRTERHSKEDCPVVPLAATNTGELLTKAYALTHQMHGLPEHSAARARFRAMRDLIDAEIIRRTN